MNLKDYFEQTRGTGVLSTADGEGRVDAAIYARPHVMEDDTVAFIMRDRLTHENLQQNPYAAYLFIERSGGYKGLRLYLEKDREETDRELIDTLSRRCLSPEENAARGPRYLVRFKVDMIRELVGGDKLAMDIG